MSDPSSNTSQDRGKQATPSQNTPSQKQSGSEVQGEGDYEAARRYRHEVNDFIEKADIDKLAHQAAPASPREAQELASAENRGRERSKGDDSADIKQMRDNKGAGESEQRR